MATLTTSPQIIGRNESSTIHTYLYGWYSDQSGNSCTVHLRLTVISSGITYTGTNKTYSINLGGYQSGVQSWSYAPLYANQEYTVAETTWIYSGGEEISGYADFWSYVYGSAWVGLSEATYVPTFVTSPSGLSVNVSEVYENGAKFNVSVSSYGNPSSASGRYIEAGICAQNSYGAPYRYQIASNTSSSAITVANNNNHGGALNIRPNTQYYYGGYATNTQASTSSIFGQLVTKIKGASFAVASRSRGTATISYMTEEDGGYYNKTLQYSLDNGTTWLTGVVISGGSARNGTFTVNNLEPDVTYEMLTRTTTPSATISGPTLLLDSRTTRLYGSVNSESKRVIDLYGSDSTSGSGLVHPTVPIKKLYGSVNDEARLVFQGFGHVKYGLGEIVYYTDSSYSSTARVTITGLYQLNGLGGSRSWSRDVGGVTITSDNIKEIYLTTKVTSLPSDFLGFCTHLDTVVISSIKATSLPAYFMRSCTNFNSFIELPPTITAIGNKFLYLCSSFNQNIALPGTLTSLGASFLYGCDNMTSTVGVGSLSADIAESSSETFATPRRTSAMFATGVTIAGSNRAAWISKFPNSGTPPCRKLINAGY